MKKIYALMAMAIAASTIGVSAYDMLPIHNRSVENAFLHKDVKLQKSEIPALPMQKKTMSDFMSRAGEEMEPVDVNLMTEAVYYDYFVNWYYQGKELQKFRNLVSSCGLEYDDLGEGKYAVKGFCGYEQFAPEIYPALDDNNQEIYVMDLGQVLAETDDFYVVLAGLGEEGADQEGSYVFTRYANCLLMEEYVGALAIDKQTNQPDGWVGIWVFPEFFLPNAELTYNYIDKNNELVEVNNRVYVEEHEAEEDDEYQLPFIWISNVMPWNEGIFVKFYYDCTEYIGEDLLMAIEQIAYPAEQISQTKYTEDFQLGWEEQVDGEGIDGQVGLLLGDYEGEDYVWPAQLPSMQVNATHWIVISEDGYGFPSYNKATLKYPVEFTTPPTGINDIKNDVDTDEAPVYYNLQGMQIANPAAGQLYIVKNGSKVSKRIIK